MSTYRTQAEYSFNYPASTVTPAQGGFSKDDTKVVGRWVTKSTGGTVILVADNGRPDGVISSLGPTKVGVVFGPFVKGKHSDNAAIAEGSLVVGATREVRSGGGQERGFIKAQNVTTVAQAVAAKGPVLESGTNTAETEGSVNTTVKMW